MALCTGSCSRLEPRGILPAGLQGRAPLAAIQPALPPHLLQRPTLPPRNLQDCLPLGVGKGTHIKGAIVDKNARIGKFCKIVNAEGIQVGLDWSWIGPALTPSCAEGRQWAGRAARAVGGTLGPGRAAVPLAHLIPTYRP